MSDIEFEHSVLNNLKKAEERKRSLKKLNVTESILLNIQYIIYFKLLSCIFLNIESVLVCAN